MKKRLDIYSDKGLERTCEQGRVSLKGRKSFSFSPFYSDKGLETHFDNPRIQPIRTRPAAASWNL